MTSIKQRLIIFLVVLLLTVSGYSAYAGIYLCDIAEDGNRKLKYCVYASIAHN